MDTSDFNNQDRQHLNLYRNFLTLSKFVMLGSIITLVLMAIFLV